MPVQICAISRVVKYYVIPGFQRRRGRRGRLGQALCLHIGNMTSEKLRKGL